MIEVMVLILGYLIIMCAGTIVLESLPVLFVRRKKAWWKASVLCNLVTNPLLNVLMLLVIAVVPNRAIFMTVLVTLEVCVICVETYFYRCMMKKSWRHCAVYALAANLISFGASIPLTMLLDYSENVRNFNSLV